MEQQRSAAKDDATLHQFLDFVVQANRSAKRGVSIIAVSMKELQAALHKGGARAALTTRLQDKAREMKSHLFNLNDSLFVLVPPQDEWNLTQVVYDIRVLVIKTVGREASELGLDPSEFTLVLHTRRDAQDIKTLADDAVHGNEGLRGPVGPQGPLTQAHIDAVEKQARTVGAVRFVREFGRMQAMARVRSAAEPEGRGHEIFISLAKLKQQLLPGVDFNADKALFQELTQVLDRIVLRSLSESRLVQGNICVNLNVNNLLSSDFERMAQRLYDRDGAQLWVDLDIPDVLGNLRDFRDAQLVLKRFRVVAMGDSTAPEMISTAEARELNLDGYKFICPAEDTPLDQMAGAIKRVFEAKRLPVLTRVENDAMIGAGQKLGVTHFQGFYINDLLSGLEERPAVR